MLSMWVYVGLCGFRVCTEKWPAMRYPNSLRLSSPFPPRKSALPMIGLPFPIKPITSPWLSHVLSISQKHHPQNPSNPKLNPFFYPLTLWKIDGKIDGFPAMFLFPAGMSQP